MNAYKIKAGQHVDGRTKKKYTKGQTVNSEQPLDKMFPEKFEDLGEVRRVAYVDEPPVAPNRAPGSVTSSPSEDETSSGANLETAPSVSVASPPAPASVPAPAKKTAHAKSTPKKSSSKVKGDDWKE